MVSTIGSRHVYGPVPSRRLGRSLGIDLMPFKVCTYDCIYCQLGRTTTKTLERKEYVAVAGVLKELKQTLATGVKPDWISLAGSGEPTLNSGLGELIKGIKTLTTIPVAVLTNGSLLFTMHKDPVTYNIALQILQDEVEHEEDLQSEMEDLETMLQSFRR